MKNRRRCHCMVVYAPYPLGETRVQREAEALVRNGYDVDVICIRLPGEPAVDVYKGIKIYREKYRFPIALGAGSGLSEKLLKYLRFFFSAGIRVTRLHLQKHYGTIQVHNLPDFLVLCALLPKLLGAAVLLDLHDLTPEFYTGRFGQSSSLGARLICLQEQIACRFADHVITVSEHWRQALIRRGVPADKCSVVMNVADDYIFCPANGSHPRAQPRQGFRLIYHGSMHQRYGLDLAVQAIDRVRHEIPGVHLSLVGAGPFLPVLRAMVDTLGLREQVSIEPLRLAEELPEIIRSCDLGVVPYRSDVFTDGLVPTKLMEYAAMELPAIAARTTVIQAYFSDANVEFFEPGNVDDLTRCILMLYHNPERMAALACGSRNFNRRFNWSRIGEAYVSLVDRLRLGERTIPS
jgi:glycosyltransferase involved in cell wall biosynthesis